MQKRLQANIDGVIIEEGYNTDEMSGRQVNITISGRHGKVGFEEGTDYRRSKTRRKKKKGSQRSSKGVSSSSKSPSIKKSKTSISSKSSPNAR